MNKVRAKLVFIGIGHREDAMVYTVIVLIHTVGHVHVGLLVLLLMDALPLLLSYLV